MAAQDHNTLDHLDKPRNRQEDPAILRGAESFRAPKEPDLFRAPSNTDRLNPSLMCIYTAQ